MSSSGLVLRAIVVASVFFACGTLKTAEQTSEPGASDAGDVDAPMTGTADGSVSDGALPDAGAVPDAGAPPADFECTEPWTTVTKTKVECAPRQVRDVEATAPIDPTGVSIAHTTTGRVGIVYNAEQDGQTGELHLAHFTPATATYADPKIVIKSTGFSFHDGYLTKLATSAPDTLAVLSYDMDDSSQSGEIHLRKLVAGTPPLTDDLVVTGVKNPTEIAVASDPMGNTYATFRIAGATTAKLSSSMKTASGAFAPLPDLTTALLPPDAPGVGGASLFVDAGGQVHLLFHHNEVAQHSTPRYHTLAGTTWSSTKTIDNAALDGLAGFCPRIAVFGTKKYAAYFFRKAGQAVPVTADLRLASWDSSMDVPTIEILDQQIPSPDPLAPVYRVAMGVDKYGLVHLAIIRPSPSTTVGFLEYRRQTRVAGGGTKWLSDIVDSDVLSGLAQAYVDMVIDENARPHIAYVSAKDGRVKYATRFDR